MAVIVSDGGRQLVVQLTGGSTITSGAPVTIGPKCNMKIIDGWWQDTGPQATPVSPGLTFLDIVGRVFNYTASTDGVPIAVGKLDWLEGPIKITNMLYGTLYIILGNK